MFSKLLVGILISCMIAEYCNGAAPIPQAQIKPVKADPPPVVIPYLMRFYCKYLLLTRQYRMYRKICYKSHYYQSMTKAHSLLKTENKKKRDLS